MERYCRQCQTRVIDDRLISCPSCFSSSFLNRYEFLNTISDSDLHQRIDILQFSNIEISRIKTESNEILDQKFSEYKSNFNKKFWPAAIFTGILSIFGIFISINEQKKNIDRFLEEQAESQKKSIADAVGKFNNKSKKILETEIINIRESVNSKTNEEFKTERIQNIVSSVAAREAQSMLAGNVRPSIEKFTLEVSDNVQDAKNKIQQSVNESKSDRDIFSRELNKLATANLESEKLRSSLKEQVDMLERSNRIRQLGYEAATHGERASLNALQIIGDDNNENKEIRAEANGMISLVKGFWLFGSKTAGQTLSITKNGSTITNENIETCDLINQLSNLKSDWKIRAIAAQLLSIRREKNVPEALLRAVRLDPQLHVVRDAVKSWISVTGHEPSDIFGPAAALEFHWKEKSSTIIPKLKPMQCSVKTF